MRLRGGYNITLSGKPSSTVEVLPEPAVLHLPLRSRRFSFDKVFVRKGERVHPGQELAKDPANYCVPLLAPRAGAVRLDAVEGHITLEDIAKEPEESLHPDEEAEHVPSGTGSSGMKRIKLLKLGAWEFMREAYTGRLPDPMGAPQALIVSTVHLEPFVARGDVQVFKRLSHFTRGLEHLQTLVEYQPIYLVIPRATSAFAAEVRERLRGYAWMKVVEIPRKYPFDHFALLARRLGLKKEAGPVWAVTTAGVLAVDRALTLSRPCTVRIVSVGGSAVESPTHLKAMPGYPLEDIVSPRVSDGPRRIICGGVMTGRALGPGVKGLDVECDGLTVLPEQTERELLGFARPGISRRSHCRGFLSFLRPGLAERMTTALRGEHRPCVACNFCDEVCPAGIIPYLIHKLLYQDELEEVEAMRIDLCVECGLCAHVCPSKIDLLKEIVAAKERIQLELKAEEVAP
ncbi:MAG: 4Fe-4S dicluster domain-containing protein [Planctomycetota bacterium]|jgi:Na(+)-translocating NADH:ubiquinone oxidoreductase A subunit